MSNKETNMTNPTQDPTPYLMAVVKRAERGWTATLSGGRYGNHSISIPDIQAQDAIDRVRAHAAGYWIANGQREELGAQAGASAVGRARMRAAKPRGADPVWDTFAQWWEDRA